MKNSLKNNRYAPLLLSAVLLLVLPTSLSAQSDTTVRKAPDMEWHRNVRYRIQYKVPTEWTLLRQANDTITVATYVSPQEDMLLFIGKRKEAASKLTPEQALREMLTEFEMKPNRIFPTRYNGIDFVETTGSGIMKGHLVQYDAMAAHHQGHVILVYVYAAEAAYQSHKNTLEQVVHSISPYRGK